MKKRIKSKVIDLVVLLEKPKNRLIRFVFVSNSIDSVILDLQEQYPNEKITRKSIMSWKFMTNAEYDELQRRLKSEPELFENKR